MVNDTNPGLYNFGARALIQLRERDHNIEGFTNPDVPLPPFPWYNIHLCDIDLHDANNFGIGVFANPATENYAHAWSWCMDLADVRVEKYSTMEEIDIIQNLGILKLLSLLNGIQVIIMTLQLLLY